ncbi:DUF3000 domain-containing protein [Kineosporia rhizophila]|uniref:DUF3000 domain-containing protein n=1 Tax=Kineosporia TaxID=49184 RepID=UPI001E39A00A|nr:MULTISPECIES: DUF3000 domain-containing protein [Kineosporia]MCE0537350.1 DUF3000 domain-containing protein [Kineosporia rhizophila]GLY17503.1 hypothetical protein Kisp01_45170 [Kineosporia sp. NBRC 101677]
MRISDDAPEGFLDVVSRLRAAKLRPEVILEEVPAPQRIAPFALALSADVVSEDDEDLATGRFVLLHDPSGPESWEGTYRVVSFIRAALESELATDPLMGQVGWAWLQESLSAAGAGHRASGGTITRVVSESFGALAGQAPTVDIELRASWTPVDDAVIHLTAWSELLCTVGGLPPVSPGVTALPRRRRD